MTFNQINYFLAVANHLNFTQAASALFVTQSTLSRSIAALENELGVALLERDFHSVKLTPAGDLMNAEMRNIMEIINALIKRVQTTASFTSSKFSIGILEGQQIDTKILLALRCLSDKYPQFSMNVKRMGHQDLLSSIRANHIDIAESVITPETHLGEEIACVPIRSVKNFLLARNDDPIWDQEDISLKSIDGRVLVVSENPHPGIYDLKRMLDKLGIHPIIREATDMETHALWLEAGMGLTVCNENNILYSSREFRPIRTVELPELDGVSIGLLWNKGYPSPLVDEFMMFIRSGIATEGSSDESHTAWLR